MKASHTPVPDTSPQSRIYVSSCNSRTARRINQKRAAFVPLFVHKAAHFDGNYGRPHADARGCTGIAE